MLSEWHEYTVRELFRLDNGYAFKSREFIDSGVPVIKIKNVKAGQVNTDSLSHVSPQYLTARPQKVVHSGDLLVTMTGNRFEGTRSTWVGKVARFNLEGPYLVNQRVGILRLEHPQKADSRFCAYVLSSDTYQERLIAVATSSGGQANISPKQILDLPIPLPPLPEQRRIAAVLGALDDKIELNRKMNRTLEAMAQALFKSWFIDFDGHDDLVPSELGPIPRGWEVGKFVDVAKQHRLTVKPEEQEPDTPYIGLADMPQRAIALAEWGHASDATSAKAQFVENDFLFGKLRPYFKKVGVAPCDGVCSSDIIVVRPKENQWYGYTLGVLTLDAFIDFTTAVSTGTRMPRVSWKAMAGYDLAIPPKERAEEFDAFVRPTVERIKANTWESRTLAALRDTLLPKLISGEIRVPEAEDGLEEAEL